MFNCIKFQGSRSRQFHIYRYSYFKEKVHATIPKGIVGDFEFIVFQEEISKNGTRSHGRMFASAERKQQK